MCSPIHIRLSGNVVYLSIAYIVRLSVILNNKQQAELRISTYLFIYIGVANVLLSVSTLRDTPGRRPNVTMLRPGAWSACPNSKTGH